MSSFELPATTDLEHNAAYGFKIRHTQPEPVVSLPNWIFWGCPTSKIPPCCHGQQKTLLSMLGIHHQLGSAEMALQHRLAVLAFTVRCIFRVAMLDAIDEMLFVGEKLSAVGHAC